MRPGQQRPGNRAADGDQIAVRVASMRPGQQRPGNQREASGYLGPRAASMRPGQQRPGNAELCGEGGMSRQGFNEAGATTPRKQPSLSSTTASLT